MSASRFPARLLRLSLAVTALALVTGCTTVTQVRYPANGGSAEAAAPATGEPVGTLAGTAWRLVEIRSIDGSVDRPREEARYRLFLDEDGTARVIADCNRGRGTWASERPSKLRFGAIATTQRLCPPGSIADRYLSRFHRVRSYAFRDDRLLLTAGSEGPTLEFAPLPAEGGSD